MKNLCIMLFALMGILFTNAQEIKHYHSGWGFDSEAVNPWATNGGTCRTTNGFSDVTLNVMIDNDSTKIKENDRCKIKNAMEKVILDNGEVLIAVPIEFDVIGDESIVDHYELCGYNHLKNNTYPIMSATDLDWESDIDLQNASLSPTNTMRIEKQEGEGPHHYNCYTINEKDPISSKGTINYTIVPIYNTTVTSGNIILSVYIKVYYNNGIEPTYHSLNNIKYSIQKIPTCVNDIEIEQHDVYYDLMGRISATPFKGINIYKGKKYIY